MGDISAFLVGAIAGGLISAYVTDRVAQRQYAPRQADAPAVADLNQDGVPDLIIKSANGHKVPLYGVRAGDHVRYLSAAGMQKRTPDSIINYATIESRLNKK